MVGLVASKIKERLHRPVIAFAPAEPGSTTLRGSARSIPGFHIRDALAAVDARHPGLIERFGGHAMAAGLTLKSGGFATFAKAYDDAVRELLKPEQLTGELWSDGELTPTELSLEIAQLLRNAGPWGQSFEEPLFDGYFKIIQQRIVGERHLKLVLETQCGTVMLDAIAFNVDLHIWPDATIQHARIVYKLDVNEYRGNFTLQLMVEQIEPM